MNLNFFCIGAAKSGTSTLHDILKSHPDIYLPEIKETKFLSKNYSKGVEWYFREYFTNFKNEKAIGEIYPCLTLNDGPKKLRDSFGKDLKLLAIFRNPVDRAYSNFLAQKRIYKHDLSFEEALDELPYLIENGLYAKSLKRFFDFFDINNTRFYIFENDLINNKQWMLNDIQRFLGVKQLSLQTNIKSNSAWKPKSKSLNRLIYNRPKFIDRSIKYFFRSISARQKVRIFLNRINSKKIQSPRLTNEYRRELIYKYFYSDIKELETILKRDLSNWYKI